MTKKFNDVRHGLKDYWMHMVRYNHHHMSRGAENLYKIITSAHGDGWRRKTNKHKKG